MVGNSGAGKTTFAAELARRLDLPHVELDGLFHLAGWQQASTEDMRAAAVLLLAKHPAGYVLDGDYSRRLGDLVATEVSVWLDYPRWVVGPRIIRRTLRRVARQEELWNGNREQWAAVLSRHPAKNVMLWSFTQHGAYRERFRAQRAADVEGTWVVLRSPREARGWLAALS